MVTPQRILVIDDDERIARTITRALEAHTVRWVDTGAAGLELAMDLDPELVICDFYLGAMTGRDVIAALRERGVTAPVLLISGGISEDEWTDWAAFLADDFLIKPFRPEMLVRKAERLLKVEALAREVARKHAEVAESYVREATEADAANQLLARMVQRGTFPDTVRVAHVPAARFGGDAVFGTEVAGRYRWMVADVTGHTLASALVTIPLSMIFYATSRRGVPLGELITTTNEQLGLLLPATMFCAATVLELDRTRGQLEIWSGGAPDIAILRASGKLSRIDATDPGLGVLRSGFTPTLITVAVEPGDRIFSFTDGLYEVAGADGALLGMGQICEALTAGPPETAYDRAFDAWRDHGNRGTITDDMSLVEVVV